jgi:C4-dicarboxylate transporter, DctM subunit
MSPVIAAYIGIGLLIIAIVLRMPVAFCMLTVGFLGMLYLIPYDAAFKFLSMDIFERFSSYSFSAIPLFVLMGYYASLSGMTRKLFDVAYIWIGQLRGGLAMATVVACAMFACVCGSSPATAATVGKLAFPQMKRYNYDDALATGSIAGAGTLGPLIPPSNGFIIYGLLTAQSIGKLFIAGILPGILLTTLFAITVYTICRIDPKLGPAGPKSTWKQKLKILPGLFEIAFVFLVVLGGLFAGFFSPTQAGAIGALAALLIGVIRKIVTWESLWASTKEALLVSCMIMCLVAGAIVFGHFLSLSTMPILFAQWIQGLPVSPIVVYIAVCVFYIVGGCFIDAMGLIVLTIPILAPIIFKLGFDPIWFGVIVVMLSETGVITPPVGVNVFVVKNIAPEVPLERIFKGILPFFYAVCIAIAIISIFPMIATFLPSLISY